MTNIEENNAYEELGNIIRDYKTSIENALSKEDIEGIKEDIRTLRTRGYLLMEHYHKWEEGIFKAFNMMINCLGWIEKEEDQKRKRLYLYLIKNQTNKLDKLMQNNAVYQKVRNPQIEEA